MHWYFIIDWLIRRPAYCHGWHHFIPTWPRTQVPVSTCTSGGVCTG